MSHHDVSDAGKDNPRTPKEVIGVHKIADAAHTIPGTVVKHVHAVIEAQAIGDADCCKGPLLPGLAQILFRRDSTCYML
jgi:hypothetical protein